MSLTKLTFSKDWKNPDDFATYEDNEATVRSDMQLLHDEARDALNNLVDELALTTDGSSGADAIGVTSISGVSGGSVQSVLESLKGYTDNAVQDIVAGTFPAGTLVEKTTADITYYVSTTGSDSNDGLSAGAPLRNIQTAINKIPQIVNHAVTINVSAGTYAEAVTISGKLGNGSITILGAASRVSTHFVTGITAIRCTASVQSRGLVSTRTGNHAFYFYGCTDAYIEYCTSGTSDFSWAGICAEGSNLRIVDCSSGMRAYGVLAATNANVTITSCVGGGNTVGLTASAGRICYADPALVPLGTAKETTPNGGQIVRSNGSLGGQYKGLSVLTSALTLYVDGTLGNDSNIGTSSGTGAFKTIQAAIDSVPKRIDATVGIVVAAGTYNETISVYGFTGQGQLYINSTSQAVSIVNAVVSGNSCTAVRQYALNATTAAAQGFNIDSNAGLVNLLGCSATATFGGGHGAFVALSPCVRIENCTFSNKFSGIISAYGASVQVINCAGTGNTYGLYSDGGNFYISGTEPTGGVQRSVNNGGNFPNALLGSGSAFPATTGTMTVVMDNTIKAIVPTGSCVFNASGGVLGQTCTFEIVTSGTTSYTLTFNTGFKANGTLATGTVSGKVFGISFRYDGAAWMETGRTGAM